MLKTGTILIAFFMAGICAFAQTNRDDSALFKAFKEELAKDTSLPFFADTTVDYDALFKDFDAFMDSILNPGSYFLTSISAGKAGYTEMKNGYFGDVENSKRMTYMPLIGYYHKSGLGISVSSTIVNDGVNINPYQFSVTPSFDYLKNNNFATGISYTRYLTKDSLPFYSTPIHNELYSYFTVRKWWVRPSLSASFGWGSNSDYLNRKEMLQLMRLQERGFIFITKESVMDFSMTASVRHDFYWLNIFSGKDHIRFTPQVSFTSGTQKFGLNMLTGTVTNAISTSSAINYRTEKLQLSHNVAFQPLSLALYLKGEYSIGKFFIQPQLMLDYYLPATTKNFNTFFSVNAGLIF